MIRFSLCVLFVGSILSATRYTHWEGLFWACSAILSLWLLTRHVATEAAPDGTEVDRG